MKRWQKIGIFFALFVSVFLYFLPHLLSLPSGNQFLLSTVNRFIAGRLQADAMSFSWSDGVALQNIVLFDPEKRQVASIETFSWRAPLLSILFEADFKGQITCKASSIDLIGEKKRGCFSIERIISNTPNLVSQNQSDEIIHFINVSCNSDVQSLKKATVELKALIDTESNQQDEGAVDIHLQIAKHGIQAKGVIERFPTEVAVTLLEVFSADIAAQVEPLFGDMPQTLSLHLDASGSLDDFLLSLNLDPLKLFAGDDLGQIDLRLLRFTGKKAKDSPLALTVDCALGLNKKESLLYGIFGETLSLSCQVPFTLDDEEIRLHNVQANIQSQKIAHTTLSFSSIIDENSFLLSEPLIGKCWTTDADAQNPVHFTIDSEGFLLPLVPFSRDAIVIKSMKVEPGKQTCKNGKLLTLLLSFLKLSLSGNQEVSVWFTPIFLELEKGIVQVKRADFLFADRFPLAIWGQADIVNNRLDMTLGISPETLSRAFLLISLDKTRFLQVPIRGSIDSPTFDTGRATAKIAALRLQQTWSVPTAILGTILNVASSVGADDPPTPPPTTTPFPWDVNAGK